MDTAQRLIAIEAIRITKANYFLGVDTKDWDLIRREVFMPETTFQFVEFREEPFIGGETILAMFADAMANVVSIHHGHMPIIEILSDTAAKGIWAMEDRIYLPSGDLFIHGFGHYHETYVRRAEGWRIATMRLTRLRREMKTIF